MPRSRSSAATDGQVAYGEMSDGQLQTLVGNGDKEAERTLREREEERQEQEQQRLEEESRRWVRERETELLQKVANHVAGRNMAPHWKRVHEEGGVAYFNHLGKDGLADLAETELERRGAPVDPDEEEDDDGLTDQDLREAKQQLSQLQRSDLLKVAGGDTEPVPDDVWWVGGGGITESQMAALAASIRDEREEERQRRERHRAQQQRQQRQAQQRRRKQRRLGLLVGLGALGWALGGG